MTNRAEKHYLDGHTRNAWTRAFTTGYFYIGWCFGCKTRSECPVPGLCRECFVELQKIYAKVRRMNHGKRGEKQIRVEDLAEFEAFTKRYMADDVLTPMRTPNSGGQILSGRWLADDEKETGEA